MPTGSTGMGTRKRTQEACQAAVASCGCVNLGGILPRSSSNTMPRSRPNILVTGTPGTGKTTTAEQVAVQAGLQHINVGQWVKDQHLHTGWDEQYQCYILDEDKVVDALDDVVSEGGCVVDHHSCDFFPERWFDLVVVLQTDNTALYDRLEKRGYPAAKVQENVECEIMMVVLEEATDNYKPEIVKALRSDTPEQLESNVAQIVAWCAAWKP